MSVLFQPLSLNPLKDMAKVEEFDYLAKMDDFDKFFRTGKVSYNILRYIPGLAKIGCQGQLNLIEMKRKYADDTYKNEKVIEFNVQITKGYYLNFQKVHLCFPLKFKSPANERCVKNDTK